MAYRIKNHPYDSIRQHALANAFVRTFVTGQTKVLPIISGGVDLSIVQKGLQQKASGTSFTLLVGTGGPTGLTTTPTAGDLIIFLVGVNQTSATTVSAPTFTNGTAGTWTSIGDAVNTGNGEARAWWNVVHSDNIASGAVSITTTGWTVARTCVLGAIEFAAADTTSPISVTPVTSTSGATRTTHPSAVLAGSAPAKDCVVSFQYVKGGEALTQDTVTTNFNPSTIGAWSFDTDHSGTTGGAQSSASIQTQIMSASTAGTKTSVVGSTAQQDANLIFAVKNAAGPSGPPGAPPSLAAPVGTVTSSSFIANWGAAAAGDHAVDFYNVYLQDVGSGGSYVLQGTVDDAATLTWTFSGLLPNWAYSVKVEAVDTISQVGTASTLSVTTHKGVNKTISLTGDGIAPRLAFGSPKVGQRVNLTGKGVASRLAFGAATVRNVISLAGKGIASRLAFGSATVIRWPAGAKSPRSVANVTDNSSAVNNNGGSRHHYTAGTVTLDGLCVFTQCVFDGRVVVNSGTAQFEDCYIDYNGSLLAALKVQGSASAYLHYVTIEKYTGAKMVNQDTTGTVTLSFVKGRPVGVAPPGPPAPKTINLDGKGIAPRLAFGSATIKAGPRAIVETGKGIPSRLAFGTIASVTNAPAGINAPLAVISPYTSADVAALGITAAKKTGPNWRRTFLNVENPDHGWRPSLFGARTDVGYMNIQWDTAAGTFKPVATTHGEFSNAPMLLSNPTHYGVFPGALNSGTTMWTDPILSEWFGIPIVYDVSGWAYLRNIAFSGKFIPDAGGSKKCLIYNVQIDNLAFRQRSDIATQWLAHDAESGWWHPNRMPHIARNILLNYPGNGNAAIQHSDCPGSMAAVTVIGYQQDCTKITTPDFWMGNYIADIHHGIRDEIENTPPRGAVWIHKTPPNTEMWLEERADTQENTAIEITKPAATGSSIPLSLTKRTVTNESWADTGKNKPAAIVTTRHFDVHLGIDGTGNVTSRMSDVKALLEADTEFAARCTIQYVGVSDGSGFAPVWTDIAGQGDRFQIPSNANGLLPHSDFTQIFAWNQVGFVPPMDHTGTLVTEPAAHGHSTDHFVTDPHYPGERGTCLFKICCLEGNHSGIYFQNAVKNSTLAGKWPNDAATWIVLDRSRILSYNTWISDGDTIACGAVRTHAASDIAPSNLGLFFTNVTDTGNPLSNKNGGTDPNTGFPVPQVPFATTDVYLNTHHVNRGNITAHDGQPIPVTN